MEQLFSKKKHELHQGQVQFEIGRIEFLISKIEIKYL